MPTHPIYTNQISSYPAASRKRWKSSPLEQKKLLSHLEVQQKIPIITWNTFFLLCFCFCFHGIQQIYSPSPSPPQKKHITKTTNVAMSFVWICIYIYNIYNIYIYTYSKQKKHPKSSPPPPKSEKSPQRRSIVVRKLDVGDRPPSPTNLQPHPLPPGGLENLDGCMFRSLNAVKECISGQNCKISPTADWSWNFQGFPLLNHHFSTIRP